MIPNIGTGESSTTLPPKPVPSKNAVSSAPNHEQLDSSGLLSQEKEYDDMSGDSNLSFDKIFHEIEYDGTNGDASLEELHALKVKIQELETTQHDLVSLLNNLVVPPGSTGTAAKLMGNMKHYSTNKSRTDQQDKLPGRRSFNLEKEKEDYQKMKIQELEENQKELKVSQRELEQNYERRIRELEESHVKKVEELKASHQQMMTRINNNLVIPPGSGDAAANDPAQDPNQEEAWQDQPAGTGRRLPTYSFFRNYEALFGSNNTENQSLENDTFSLMMLSKVNSRAWALGLAAFVFQILLCTMIAYDQHRLFAGSSTFDVPFKITTVVRVGQIFCIILCLATQSDILTSIQSTLTLSRGSSWDKVIGERGNKSPCLWVIRILLPNLLKFVLGVLVIFVSFAIIVQSDDIIGLLKDFTVLIMLSETDNILFHFASYGFLGQALKEEAARVLNTRVPPGHSSTDLSAPATGRYKVEIFNFRSLAFFSLFASMTGGWIMIVRNQLNGKYFSDRYPNCTVPDAFELATKYFGDGMCYGGPLNTLGCEFEDGDCVDFNLAFPLCKGVNRTDVQENVGNGICDPIFMNADCDFDGGDCCSYEIMNDQSFGDGRCDKRMNNERCGFDNGDCIAYNHKFAGGCSLDNVYSHKFGDGQCNGGTISSEACRYDNGDCDAFRQALFPKCPLEELSEVEGADHITLGDGVCDSGIYNIAECGYENGDCKYGQLGQTVLMRDKLSKESRLLYFSKTLSLDGMTISIGLSRNDENGNFNGSAPGLVKVWRYISSRKTWQQLGNTIVGDSDGANFGHYTALSSNGNHIAVLSDSTVKVFQYDIVSVFMDDWRQIGQNIILNNGYWGDGIEMSADGMRLALIDFDKISIYDLEAHSSGVQKWVTDDRDVIDLGIAITQPRISTDYTFLKVQLKLNSLDSSILMLNIGSSSALTKIFQLKSSNSTHSWIQIGQDILSPSRTISSSISADGSRIAISSHYASTNVPGWVHVYDYHPDNRWVVVGDPIRSSSSRNGDGFGFSISMSSDGNILMIGSNSPECQLDPNVFDMDQCTTGSVELFIYQPETRQFQNVVTNHSSPYAKGDIITFPGLSGGGMMFGLHYAMNGNGTVFTVSGYNFNYENAFAEAYVLDDLFLPGATS